MQGHSSPSPACIRSGCVKQGDQPALMTFQPALMTFQPALMTFQPALMTFQPALMTFQPLTSRQCIGGGRGPGRHAMMIFVGEDGVLRQSRSSPPE
eukprot:3925853-Rhodomonas_salina.1